MLNIMPPKLNDASISTAITDSSASRGLSAIGVLQSRVLAHTAPSTRSFLPVTGSERLGDVVLIDEDHVRPGLTSSYLLTHHTLLSDKLTTGYIVNQEEYAAAKDAVLDLLGWGVPSEYLVDCCISRELLYYVFTELNLCLPSNLDITAAIPYPPSHMLFITPPAPPPRHSFHTGEALGLSGHSRSFEIQATSCHSPEALPVIVRTTKSEPPLSTSPPTPLHPSNTSPPSTVYSIDQQSLRDIPGRLFFSDSQSLCALMPGKPDEIEIGEIVETPWTISSSQPISRNGSSSFSLTPPASFPTPGFEKLETEVEDIPGLTYNSIYAPSPTSDISLDLLDNCSTTFSIIPDHTTSSSTVSPLSQKSSILHEDYIERMKAYSSRITNSSGKQPRRPRPIAADFFDLYPHTTPNTRHVRYNGNTTKKTALPHVGSVGRRFEAQAGGHPKYAYFSSGVEPGPRRRNPGDRTMERFYGNAGGHLRLWERLEERTDEGYKWERRGKYRKHIAQRDAQYRTFKERSTRAWSRVRFFTLIMLSSPRLWVNDICL